MTTIEYKEMIANDYYEEINFAVVRETEKAVAIENPAYYDEVYNTAQAYARENMSSLIWLPKSQVIIENGCVVDMADWLAKKNGFHTTRMIEAEVNAFERGCDRYTKALEFAKSNGLNVRSRMKLANIMSEIKAAGLVFNY